MSKIIELKQKRAALVRDIRKVSDKMSDPNNIDSERNLADYNQKIVQMEADFDRISNEIDFEERQNKREEFLDEVEGTNLTHRINPDSNNDKNVIYSNSFDRYLINGRDNISSKDLDILARGKEIHNLQSDDNTKGGYLVPKEFREQLIQKLDDMLWFRQLANVLPATSASSVGNPTIENDPSDADWTSEVAAVQEDSTLSFGERELTPHLCSKLIKVSMKLLRGAPNVQGIISDRFAYKFGATEEKAFLTGNGVKKPLGVFTASSQGISTSRDFQGSNTTSAIVADTLRDIKYSVKSQYRGNASWLFHRDGVKQISKLKDSQNQYLWQPGLREGDPDRLLGAPIRESEYVPNTFTANQYVGIYGDFKMYDIIDSLLMEVQRLNELYAGNNKVGFIMRKETDGMPVHQEAFARIKLGS